MEQECLKKNKQLWTGKTRTGKSRKSLWSEEGRDLVKRFGVMVQLLSLLDNYIH